MRGQTMIVLSRNRYFLSCHEIICFFKPYSIGFSPWCHGYDYEYYTITTQILAGAFKLAGVQYISELHSSRSSGAGNTNTIKSMSTRLFTPGLGWFCQPRRCGTYGKTKTYLTWHLAQCFELIQPTIMIVLGKGSKEDASTFWEDKWDVDQC